jgi:hypothetical protein
VPSPTASHLSTSARRARGRQRAATDTFIAMRFHDTLAFWAPTSACGASSATRTRDSARRGRPLRQPSPTPVRQHRRSTRRDPEHLAQPGEQVTVRT